MRQIARPISPYLIDVPGQEYTPARAGLTLSTFCLGFAALAALTGMTLGIVMGIRQDFTLAPAHAHLNLLGWVTMAIYGLYHRTPGRIADRLGWAQALSAAAGAVLMSGGLGLYLASGDHGFVPVIITGSLLAFLGMALFLLLVVRDRPGIRA